VHRDAELARSVLASDDAVDSLRDASYHELTSFMERDPKAVASLVFLGAFLDAPAASAQNNQTLNPQAAANAKAALQELLKTADVLVQNLAPGAAARLGLSYDALKEINPKMASDIAYWSKEFGVTGPQLHEAIRSHGTHVEKIRAAVPDTSSTTASRRALGTGPPVLKKAKLQVLSGAFAGRELELTKALTTLGRPGVQVAAITRRSEGYFIVHVDSDSSNNPPLVNGAPIGEQARKLADNDVIQLAGVKMGFFEG